MIPVNPVVFNSGPGILVNQLTLVELLDCSSETKRDPKELPRLHWSANEATERLASGIFADEHQLFAVPRDLERPCCPCRVQFTAQRILMVQFLERFQARTG